MEIVVHNKNPLFQQKFHKKLYRFNRNSQLRSDVKNDLTGLPESITSDSLRLRNPEYIIYSNYY